MHDAVQEETSEHNRQRYAANHIADILWSDLLGTEDFIAESGRAVEAQLTQLLSDAAKRFPENPEVADAQRFLESHAFPDPAPSSTSDRVNLDIFHPPQCVSKYGQTGLPDTYSDDLTERIFAAYCILKRCGHGDKAPVARIAAALNHAGVLRSPPCKTPTEKWVRDDVKQRIARRRRKKSQPLQQAADALIRLWVGRYLSVLSAADENTIAAPRA
jgi:hypothetical protein